MALQPPASELNFAHEKRIRLKRTDTQALIVDLKKHELPFEPLFGFEVSYKSVERLHSDEAGDGTGYHQAMGCSRERESK